MYLVEHVWSAHSLLSGDKGLAELVLIRWNVEEYFSKLPGMKDHMSHKVFELLLPQPAEKVMTSCHLATSKDTVIKLLSGC